LLTISDLSQRLEISKRMCEEIRPLLLEGYSLNPGAQPTNTLLTENKTSFRDIVTKYDKEAEAWIESKLNKYFPGELIIGEESCASQKSNPRDLAQPADLAWIVDPIDGTTNFSRSYPFFCTTWSLVQKTESGHEPILGIIYNPVSQECFWTSKGGGSWVNGHRMKCTSISNPQEALFVTGFASLHEKIDGAPKSSKSINIFSDITQSSLGVRRDGSAALDLAYLAAGRVDGYWEKGLSAWDVSAGILMVEEAGGKVTHHDGDPVDIFSGEILSSNSSLHKWLKDKVKGL